MRKLFGTLLFLALLVVVFSAGAIAAKPQKTNGTSFSLPSSAKQISENVYYLGKANVDGRQVDGYAIVDKRKGFGKPGTQCGNGICEPSENANNCSVDCGGDTGSDTSSCYGYLAKGAVWKSKEPWMVNTVNTRNLSESSVFNTLTQSIETWEDAADGFVDGTKGQDILGPGSITSTQLVADTSSPDNKNEVYFADIAEDNVVGVTIVWGYFSGPPFARELIEWDQVYNDVDYDWSQDCTTEDCKTKMDFPNISIHELGHSVGLADVYEPSCAPVTMYGYGGYGETHKRTLEDGDIKGISGLY